MASDVAHDGMGCFVLNAFKKSAKRNTTYWREQYLGLSAISPLSKKLMVEP